VEHSLGQAQVIHALPAPTEAAVPANARQVQPFPAEIWRRLSRTEDEQERESRPEVREPEVRRRPPSANRNPKLERERGSWGRVSLCKPPLARTELIRSGSLK